MVHCKECKSKMMLLSSSLVSFEPDDEPYESGEHITVNDPELTEIVHIHYCEKCRKIKEVWID